MEKQYIVRKVKLEDKVRFIDGLLSIFSQGTEYLYYIKELKSITLDDNLFKTLFEDYIEQKNKDIYVLEDKDEIIGICYFERGSLIKNNHLANIDYYLDRRYFDKEIDNILLSQVISDCANIGIRVIEARCPYLDKRLMNVYKDLGFLAYGIDKYAQFNKQEKYQAIVLFQKVLDKGDE